MIFSEANKVIVAFSRIYVIHSQKFFLLLFHSSFGYLTLPYSGALVTFRPSPLGLQPMLSKGSDQLGQIEISCTLVQSFSRLLVHIELIFMCFIRLVVGTDKNEQHHFLLNIDCHATWSF